ncbi:MAG: hypothetical protein KF886_23795 [Candidatus Hydrogenedentes bacterium]|nr:hypothetical protein [Candidatus Hydrogenedentota bacterium]
MFRMLLLLSVSASVAALELPEQGGLAAHRMEPAAFEEGPAAHAVDHFVGRLRHWSEEAGTDAPLRILVGRLDADERLARHFTPEKRAALTRDLKPFQREQAYAIARVREGERDVILAGGLTERGVAYAVSELETRLRVRANGAVYLDFPEWDGDGPTELFEYPAIEERGEYINIGYNIPGITPHEWNVARWRDYIDQLALARLNRLYFYIWVDAYSMNPASKLSEKPLNKTLHENVRAMIPYARSRGLEVAYMFCPTFFPRDLWDANPDIHAEITYVDHGFPAVCANAPGAWDLMLANARSEMEWFREADAIQIWFYDPGGCWCEKNGCAADQPGSIARQLQAFGALFREYNPEAKLEFNLWPVWVWEDIKKLEYRDEIGARIKADFPGHFSSIAAVGGDHPQFSFPIREKALGFRASSFLFGTNPESGYAFLIPSLRWTPELVRAAHAAGLDGAFGHRLEAWTRLPATWFLGAFLWDPEMPPGDAVRRWAGWQCGRPEAIEGMAGIIEDLERYTDGGPTVELGNAMGAAIERIWPGLPPAARADLEYFPAMLEGLRIIGESLATEDPARLAELGAAFVSALGESSALAPLAAQGTSLFDRYRGLLKPGWRQAPF